MPERIDELTKLLRALPPRDAQTLSLRLLEGRTRDECAQAYGISPEAFDVKLYRAAAELFAAEQRSAPQAPPPFAEEMVKAARLAAALEKDPSAAKPTPEAALLAELAAAAQPLKAALVAAELAYEASPRGRREDRIRDVLVVIIILLTLYFFLYSKTPS